ncbi:MAG: hypothetical protein RLY20_1328 [Verrucomicrobiota bacterium]|jgi:hypothetical protein
MKTNLKPLASLFAALALASRVFGAEPAAPAAPAAPEAPSDASKTNKSSSVSVSIGSTGINITAPEDAGSSETVLGIPKDILDKMPPEKVAELAKEQARLRETKTDYESILVPMFVFGMPVAIVAVVVYFRHRRNRMLHETLRTMIEKGVAIPPELLQPHEPRKQPKSDFRRGLVWIAIGTGLTVFFLVSDNHAWPIGLIPLLIGVAFLITWKVEGSKNGSNPA